VKQHTFTLFYFIAFGSFMNGTYRSVLISEITWCRSQLNSPEKAAGLALQSPETLFSEDEFGVYLT
jgi:hypothetical protein